MEDIENRIEYLESKVKEYKNELRRVKSTINKLEKLRLSIPSELLFKKENIEDELKDYKQELKELKKVVQLIKLNNYLD